MMSSVPVWAVKAYLLVPDLLLGAVLLAGGLALIGIWKECKSSTTKHADNGIYKPRR